MRYASYESSIFLIRLVINPAQQLCLTSPMHAIFVLKDLFWLKVSFLAIVRQTSQTRPSFGIKLRNVDPEVNPQVLAFKGRTKTEIVISKVDFIFIFKMKVIVSNFDPLQSECSWLYTRMIGVNCYRIAEIRQPIFSFQYINYIYYSSLGLGCIYFPEIRRSRIDLSLGIRDKHKSSIQNTIFLQQ